MNANASNKISSALFQYTLAIKQNATLEIYQQIANKQKVIPHRLLTAESCFLADFFFCVIIPIIRSPFQPREKS